MSRIIKKYSFVVILIAIISVIGIFVVKIDTADSATHSATFNPRCDKKGTSGGCEFIQGPHVDFQAWKVDFSVHVEGHGSLGPSGGNSGFALCLTPNGVMWTGTCWTVVQSGVNAPPACSYSVPPDFRPGKIGDSNCTYTGSLSDANPEKNNKISVLSFYANDATWEDASSYITTHWRRVWNFHTSCASNCSPNVGETFRISWQSEQADHGVRLRWEGALGKREMPVLELGSMEFTCTNSGTTTFYTDAIGPSGNGLITETKSVSVTCTPAQTPTPTSTRTSTPTPTTFTPTPTSAPVCTIPASPGRLTYQIHDGNLNHRLPGPGYQREPVAASIPAGTYKVILDGYDERPEVPDEPNEVYHVVFREGSTTKRLSQTGNSHDIPANSTHSPLGYIENVTIPPGVGNIYAEKVTDKDLIAVCMALDPIPTNNASCVEDIDAPDTVNAGDSFQVNATMWNTGNKSWQNILDPKYKLGLVDLTTTQPDTTWGATLIDLPYTPIDYNKAGTFTWNAIAPDIAGDYTMRLRMTEESVEYFGSVCTKNIKVIGATPTPTPVPNDPPTVSNTNSSTPLLCGGFPRAIVNWTYNDPNNNPPGTDAQSAYQVQADDNSDFSSIEHDSGKRIGDVTSYTINTGLDLGMTYYYRVRVWDSLDADSLYSSPKTFTMPVHGPPDVAFSWSPIDIPTQRPVSFTDETTSSAPIQSWNWDFNCISESECDINISSKQNPINQYYVEKAFDTTLTVSDDLYTCSAQTTISIGESNPISNWIEVSPN